MGSLDHDGAEVGREIPGEAPTHANAGTLAGDGWLRSVMESSSEIIKVVDPDGTLRYVNSAFGRVFGYDPEEAVGSMNVLEQVHPDDLPRILEATEKALAEGGVARNRVEYRFRHADGSWRWIEGIGTYLQDDPEIGGVVVNARDVTERRETEAKLRESEERFRGIFEDAPIGVAMVSLPSSPGADRRYLRVNRALCEMLGYPEEVLLSMTTSEVTHPEDIQRRAGTAWSG